MMKTGVTFKMRYIINIGYTTSVYYFTDYRDITNSDRTDSVSSSLFSHSSTLGFNSKRTLRRSHVYDKVSAFIRNDMMKTAIRPSVCSGEAFKAAGLFSTLERKRT